MKFILLMILVMSCASTSETRKDLNEVFQGAGVEQYFLPELPVWANFTTLGGCHRAENMKFFNFKNLSASYALDYEQAVQLQYMFNIGIQQARYELGKEVLTNEDESFVFYNVYEQIIGGSREFVNPKYERVHVIWVDEAIKNEKVLARLKKLMESKVMELGHPIFLSMCLPHAQMQTFVSENNFNNYGVKYISMEMFSPYGDNFELDTYYDIKLEQLMKGKKIYFFAPQIPAQYKYKSNINKY